jgi:hypothetical protein
MTKIISINSFCVYYDWQIYRFVFEKQIQWLMHFNLIYKMFWEKLIAFWHNLKLSFRTIILVFNELFNVIRLEIKAKFGSLSCKVSEIRKTS